MSNHGWHYTPCNRTSGAGLAVAAIGAAVVYLNRHAIERAASDLLEIVLACAAAVFVIGVTAAVLVLRRHGRIAPVGEQILANQEARRVQAARQRPAIAAPAQHVHFHFGSDAQPEAVLRAIAENQQQRSTSDHQA
jgi:hypothetical protein